MDLIPDKRKVVALVEQAHEGKLCLPDFQRDFVWSREEVADLLRSILRSYYIGSLLLLRTNPFSPPFKPAFLKGAASPYAEPRPEYLALDGQQRLTSLLYALTAPDLPLKDTSTRRWFFIDLQQWLDDPSHDEIVFERSTKDVGDLLTAEAQYRRKVLPCTTLLKSGDFLKWRDGLDDWLRDNDPAGHKLFRSEWRDKWTSLVTTFQGFEVPLVELPLVSNDDTAAIGRICAIFEKLNSTGVALSVYDLLTARLYPYGIRLHELWDEACETHSRLAEWSQRKVDTNSLGVLILRTLALLRRAEPKATNLINLNPENFETDWRRAAAAMERALELVTHVGPDGFGVFDRKWLPGFGLLPVLAALRRVLEERKLGDHAREQLRRWYWCSVFLERYSTAVESKTRRDYWEMLGHWTEGRPEPSIFAEARARIGSEGFSVRDSLTFSSSVYSGVFCLLALRGARDWQLGESIQLQQLQDHHIFPQAYLRRHHITSRAAVNNIVNRTLIGDATNLRIRDKAPAHYVDDTLIFPHGPTNTILGPHFIGGEAVSAMRLAREPLNGEAVLEAYDTFLQAREVAILEEVRRVCGIPTPLKVAETPLAEVSTTA